MTAAFATWLFAAAWKGSLLVALALVLHRIARNRIAARWWCALLLVALVRLLAPVLPATSFSVYNLIPSTATGAPVFVVADDPLPAAQTPRRVRMSVPPPASPSSPWTSGLLAVWGAGAGFVLLRTARQVLLFRRRLAGSINVVRDDVTLLVDECRTRIGVRRAIRVASTSAVASPSLHGWLRPALLLPPGFLESFSSEQLRYVVLHELAHLRRSDVLVNWVATAARILHWFNPLVHLAVARLAEERELACDALALEALRAEERPAYGGTVLEIVDRMQRTSLVPALVGMTATPQQLKRRIVMIASFRRQSRHSLLFAAIVAAVALVTLTDARAGQIRHLKHAEELSPAAKIVVESLETPMSLEFNSTPLSDVLNAISNFTGTSITTDGALDEAAQNARLNIKGANVPAHLVLYETLSALNLGVKFTDTGVQVVKLPEGGLPKMRVHMGAPVEGEDPERVVIIHEDDDHETLPGDRVIERMEVRKTAPSADGKTNRRSIKFKSDQDGKVVEGTFELEVLP